MKVNNKVISIPPFISTTWNQVRSLHMKGFILCINLVDGKSVDIPNLPPEAIELIFNSHTAYIENDVSLNPMAAIINKAHPQAIAQSESSIDPNFSLGFGTLDELGNVLQHNPAQADAPEIPEEIVQKIAMIAKIVAPSDLSMLPKPETHCNCIHCQVSRAMLKGIQGDNETDGKVQTEAHIEEEITDDDLTFQQWEISQSGQNLFTVINKLDSSERYSVYLGHPVGCTCGKVGCEHIIAVLKS